MVQIYLTRKVFQIHWQLEITQRKYKVSEIRSRPRNRSNDKQISAWSSANVFNSLKIYKWKESGCVCQSLMGHDTMVNPSNWLCLNSIVLPKNKIYDIAQIGALIFLSFYQSFCSNESLVGHLTECYRISGRCQFI